jgi:KaiC/GvpD/RAD55 family RecA-like ATPase
MGKSSFSVNLATVMAANGQRVLYVGNEDQIDNLKARALARAANMTLEQAENDQEAAFAAYERRGLEDRLLFSQLSKGSVEALRARVEEWKPTVLVIDQIRNLESGEDGLPARLEYNGQMVRRLLLDYGLIGISVTQAGGSAEGKVWLTMNDMDSSKTGLPGTADLIIGVGGNADMMARGQRALSFPKNKLSSAENAHEGIIVEIDHSRSSFK